MVEREGEGGGHEQGGEGMRTCKREGREEDMNREGRGGGHEQGGEGRRT